ncbi:FtsX-like permease family protein [Ktedonosporobacter rubrisoli]|uniref:FtsX-like permease family protein n=1 Tax=Ktedonosporobacter rubrisoli TaxID=2509675 RepID=A0A4P6JJI3_KTERU|nr:FtsX-like permease family protein [Ktedonosporobacter rubrisoli]QBD75268.1 FtsX-like permease family protein [Ktedonosporobacter rubrisoli]
MIKSAIARKALTDVTRRPGRTLLAVLGIMIGVLGLTAINVAGEITNNLFASGNDLSRAANLSFSVQSIQPSRASSLATVPNVQIVQIGTRYQTRWHVATKSGHIGLTILGYQDLQHIQLSPFQLINGRLPGPGEIIMEESNSQIQAVAVGDQVTIDTAQGPQKLRVAGISRTPGLAIPIQSNVTQAYMTSAALSRLTASSGANDIEIKLYDKQKVNETAHAIATILQKQGVTIFDVALVQAIPAQSVSNTILSVMRLIALVALILSGFLIIITVTTMLAEQTRIIGIMKAMGGTRLAIMGSYLLTIAIYGALGTLLGTGLGIAGGYGLASFMLSLFTKNAGALHFSPGILLPSIAAGLGVPLLAALFPLWHGTRITVREAIGAYGVTSQNASTRKQPGNHLTWVPQTVWLGVRGIFRKRGRAILTLLALTLAGTVFLSVQTAIDSFNRYSSEFFGIYKDDVRVTLATPQPYDQVYRTARAIPNVAHIERMESSLTNTKWGRLELFGVDADTKVYSKHLIAGRWFATNETQVIVISQVMANKSGLKVGDMLSFSNALKTVRWRIIGEVYDPNNPTDAGMGLTPLANYASFAGLSNNLVKGIAIQGTNRSPQAVAQMAERFDTALSRMGMIPNTETEQERDEVRRNTFTIVFALFYTAEAIVALVGILGIFNTLTTSVLERRREIGVLRSLGATNWRVATVFWLEGIALALIAWLVGSILGVPGAYGFVSLLGAVFIKIPFSFQPLMLLNMFAFTIAMVMLASSLPVLGAVRIRIADALRYE